MPTELVSIIMNCHNGEEYLQEALDSVYAQTYAHWEIIFWDNASSDSTRSIVEKCDERLRYYRTEELSPLGEARNLAMQKAQGKYITFLDCDDKFSPHKLETQLKEMEASDCALSYSGVIIIDAAGNQIKKMKPRYLKGNNFLQQLSRYEIMMPGVMLSREILEEERIQFNTDLKYCPDYHLFMRVLAKYPAKAIPEFLTYYRRHANALSLKTLHLVEPENRWVLDDLKARYPGLYEKYPNVFRKAYRKLSLPRARNLIAENEMEKAKDVLREAVLIDYRCFVLYCLLNLPRRFFVGLVSALKLNISLAK